MFCESRHGVQILDSKGYILLFDNEMNLNQNHGLNISDHFLNKETDKDQISHTRASSHQRIKSSLLLKSEETEFER